MAHSLTIAPSMVTPVSTSSKKTKHFQSLGLQRGVLASQRKSSEGFDDKQLHRRTLNLGLAGTILGLNVGGGGNAIAARRPPPPPPEEKKDPNVSGVQAKVLASKKRKEAMKNAMAKLREKGKPIDQPTE